MPSKATYRHYYNKDQNIESQKRHYKDQEAADRYADNYIKRYYRTIGFKLNVLKEKEMLAYIDYQPQLKSFITGLIKKDMLANPETVDKALALYEETQKQFKEGNIIRQGDILMKCPKCGYSTAIRLNSYLNKPNKHICPDCSTKMNAINPPEDDIFDTTDIIKE